MQQHAHRTHPGKTPAFFPSLSKTSVVINVKVEFKTHPCETSTSARYGLITASFVPHLCSLCHLRCISLCVCALQCGVSPLVIIPGVYMFIPVLRHFHTRMNKAAYSVAVYTCFPLLLHVQHIRLLFVPCHNMCLLFGRGLSLLLCAA